MKHNAIMEKHPSAEEAVRRWDQLKEIRARHEGDWEDIARLIRPQRGGFTNDNRKDRTLEKPLSSEPILAQASFAAGIYSDLTNPASRWAGLQTPDKDLNAWKPMAEWNDLATRIVFNSFGPAVSSFYSATHQAYGDIAAFGNAAHYDEIDTANRRFIDVTLSIAEVVVDIDAHGRVNEVVRKFTLKPRAAVREYGEENLPAKLVELATKGRSDDVVFYNHILPNDQFVAGSLGSRGKRFLSITACEIETSLVRQKGYQEMPFYYPRWDVDSGMTYGTGVGMIALPSARMVHQMDAATIRAAQFAADPAKLAPDRNTIPLEGVVRPGNFVYGGIDVRGNAMIRNMEFSPNIGLTIEEKRAKVEAVKEAYQYAIMSLTGRTGVTREESMIMEEARLRNWAPHADRVMEEYAARKVERRFRMLWRAGQIPAPPKEAQGLPLIVHYQSAATRAMKAREGQAIRQFIGDLGALAQMGPKMAQRIDDRSDADGLLEALHDSSPSLPASVLASRDDADQLARGRAEQQQQAQQMQMLQQGGGVAKDLAQAAGAVGMGPDMAGGGQ